MLASRWYKVNNGWQLQVNIFICCLFNVLFLCVILCGGIVRERCMNAKP